MPVKHRIFAIKAFLITDTSVIQIFSLTHLALFPPILCMLCLPNVVKVVPQRMCTVCIHMSTNNTIIFSKGKLAKKAPRTKETISDSESDPAVEVLKVLESSSVTVATLKKR